MAETPFDVRGGRVGVSETAGAFKVRGLRWLIVSLIFLPSLINYIDRLTISVLAPVITKDLGLSNTEFGGVVTWFLLAYTISQSVSGKLYDRIGTRMGFTFSIITWSAAAAGHAFARGLTSLSALRFVLGFGEAGNWPGAAKAVAEWFPIRERARDGDFQLGGGHRLRRRAAAHRLAPTALRLADDLP